MRKSVIAGLAAGALLALGLGAPATAVESGKAELFVLHGVPDTPVDVYVNGTKTLPNFMPGSLEGPLSLDPGSYTFDITAVGDPIGSAILSATVPLAADTSYTAAAHLDAGGAAMISLFTNDISMTASGEGRLTVRHVAAAPAVDILANDAVAFPNLENPDEVKADLAAGTIQAKVNLAGTSTTAIGPAPVTISEGVNTIVYAWGSANDENLALAVQTLDTMGAPGGVNAGTAPMPSNDSAPYALIIIAALALVGAGLATRTAIAARR